MSGCAECGMATEGAGEFHPYALCLIMKAGRSSVTARKNLAFALECARSVDPETKRRVDEFLSTVAKEHR